MATLASLVVKIVADATAFQQGLESAQSSLNTFQKTMGKIGREVANVGKNLTTSVTLPLVGIGTAAAVAATDFDREMRNIQSISKASDAEIAQLSQTILAMSRDITKTTDSAASLAAGFYQIQSSGFAGADAMTVLEASTKAASAGLTSTETAAKAILATLNAYGMTADQATRVSDVLFKTVDIGVLSFEELAMNLGDIVGTGNVAGVTIEELGAAMATMTKGGISAAEASTALNQLMLSFISPSAAAAKAAAALGIELNAQMLASKGLAGAMAEILEKTGGSAEAMATLFPNVRALKAALALTRGEMGPFSEDLKAVGNAAGATANAFEIQTRSFDAQMKSFRNTVGALLIELGQALLPILIDLAKSLIPLIQRFGELSAPVKQFIVIGGMVAAALGPLLVIVGQIISAIGVIGGAISGIIGALGAMLPVVIAVAAVAGLLYLAWRDNWFGIRDTLASVWGSIKSFLDELWNYFAENLPAAIETLSRVWSQSLLPALQVIWDFLVSYVFPVFNELVNIWIAIMTKAIEVLSAVWMKLKPVLVEVASALSSLLAPKLREIWNLVSGSLIPVFRDLANTLMSGVRSALTWVSNKLRDLAQTIRDLKLPGWLTPGSPTPFEIGLRGIGDALHRLARYELPEMTSELRFAPIPVASGSAGTGASTFNITINAPGGNPDQIRTEVMRALQVARSRGLR